VRGSTRWVASAVTLIPNAAGVSLSRQHERALTIVAEGRTPDVAKPLKGLGSGVLELALRHRGDAFRVVYAVQLGADIWVIPAFQKKSRTGIKTPKAEIDLIRQRLRRVKEILQ
jgi:phage-related protein